MRNLLPLLIPGLIIFSSCEKEETPVTLPPRDLSVQMMSVNMGLEYDKQIFVDLVSGKQNTTDNNLWDLSFDASPMGFQVFMNGGKNVLIANSGFTQFNTISNPSSLLWRWDESSGKPDSIVLGKWCNWNTRQTFDSVYVIDRGLGKDKPDNFFQFKIKAVDANRYLISVADLNGQFLYDSDIKKDASKNLVYFTFANGGSALNIEPQRHQWHFTFLRYRWIYYEFNPPLLYQVCGVHLNRHLVEVAVDSTLNFYDIKLSDGLNQSYSDRRDMIGFEWKYPDFTPNGVRYRTRNYINYFIREKNSGHIYKLRFLDFYDDAGNKGSPRFEYQLLK